MPTRTGPGFEFEAVFKDYCLSHGVKAAAGTYRSCMNSVAAHLNIRLGPAILRSENDVQAIVPKISETKFNRYHRSNFKSVLRKYVEMVRSNFGGLFNATIVPAIDVDPDSLPPRIRTEISRLVRDTAMTRAIKRLYEGECQICSGKLKLTATEYYVEAHHLRPLGRPHNGPDQQENIICACPNCHVLLDFGALPVGSKTIKVRKHAIGQMFIDYHNDRCR